MPPSKLRLDLLAAGTSSIKVLLEWLSCASLTGTPTDAPYAHAQWGKTLCMRPARLRVPVRTQRRTQKTPKVDAQRCKHALRGHCALIFLICGMLMKHIIGCAHGHRPCRLQWTRSETLRPVCVVVESAQVRPRPWHLRVPHTEAPPSVLHTFLGATTAIHKRLPAVEERPCPRGP